MPIIILSIVSLILFLVICLIILICRRLKSYKNKAIYNENDSMKNTNKRFIAQTAMNITSSPDMKVDCLYGGHLGRTQTQRNRGIKVFTYKELEVATGGFNEANVIARGSVEIVYRGVLSDGILAAVKMLNRVGKQGECAFRVEVDLLSRFNFPYLVGLLGYCADQHHRLLIFEFVSNGSLRHHLHNQKQPLDWVTRLRIALDCATALEFLHEHAIPPVIHRDFKCTNVLLDQNLRAKVSDFGLVKTGSDKINGQISTRVLGTTGYLAPEYASSGKLTTKFDVYSYGIVLLELLTGLVPVDIKRPPGEHVLVSWKSHELSILQYCLPIIMINEALKRKAWMSC